MENIVVDLSQCSALVVDGNPTSRSVVVSQLRELGVRQIVQTARTGDARRQLESHRFDFVLCELFFPEEHTSGQDLLDDLRRNHMLPFSTIFIMITGEATYARVAEAAESALDGYLLKPHRASHLEERLLLARVRKRALQEIFDAIDTQDFEHAARLCLTRFETRDMFWLYAARIGAELLLRLERYDEAQVLYKAVVAAKTLPWAKLGIARAQLEAGQLTQATSSLERLIGEDPNFADAYDVMGRAQFELGQFDKALSTYKMAAMLTPSSITRLQNVAMMLFYAGSPGEAERALEKATRIGLESKMFDCQTLVLLAFSRLETEDRRGLQRCQDDFARLVERNPDNARILRLSHFVTIIAQVQRQEQVQALQALRDMATRIRTPDFDFESAGNLLALITQLQLRRIPVAEAPETIHAIGMRFCSNRCISEMLSACAKGHEPYAELIRDAHASVLLKAEAAMTLSMAGDAGSAIADLLEQGRQTLNVRLIDAAYQLVQKHQARLPQADALRAQAQELKRRAGAGNRKASLGSHNRRAGGVVLRTTPREGSADAPPAADV